MSSVVYHFKLCLQRILMVRSHFYHKLTQFEFLLAVISVQARVFQLHIALKCNSCNIKLAKQLTHR